VSRVFVVIVVVAKQVAPAAVKKNKFGIKYKNPVNCGVFSLGLKFIEKSFKI